MQTQKAELERSLKQIDRRNRYIRKLEAENHVIRVENIEDICDPYDLQEDVAARLQKEQLHVAIQQLSDSEQKMIQSLYYDDVSLRQYAKDNHIALSTCYARKEKILSKLRKFMME